MTTAWSPDALVRIDTAGELRVATRRHDGTLRRWVPIWVVTVAGQVYARTWVRRSDGWYGHALKAGRARIAVPEFEADVVVEDVRDGDAELRGRIDAAYRAKYGRGSSTDRMAGDEAAATTLRFTPD